MESLNGILEWNGMNFWNGIWNEDFKSCLWCQGHKCDFFLMNGVTKIIIHVSTFEC